MISKMNIYFGAVKFLYVLSAKCQVPSFRSVAATENMKRSDIAWLVEALEAEIESFHTCSEPSLGLRI